MLAGQEDRMVDDNTQNQIPGYSFQGSSQTDEFLEIARIHHKEAKQLLESAQVALAEGRQEEAKLLLDLGVARRNTAEEFEKAAKGEGNDPIVTEILDWQKDLCEGYTPYTSTYVPPDDKLPDGWLQELQPPKLGRIARAVAWIGGMVTKK
jgi:hypothetical protein